MATGLWGALVILVGSVAFGGLAAAGWDGGPSGPRYALLLSAAFAVMAGREVAVAKVHRRNFDFGSARPLDAPARRRVLARWGALVTTLAAAVAAYTVLGHYGLDLAGRRLFGWNGSWYAPFFPWLFGLGAAAALLGLPYAALCERHGRWGPDDDELLRAARGYRALLALGVPDPGFWSALRSFLVKFFFLPLMVVFLAGNAARFEGALRDLLLHPSPSLADPGFQALAFGASYHGLYLLDVGLAVVGYACALRILDTHVRSVDATASGWIVALACYPPFSHVTDLYLGYGLGEHGWTSTFRGNGAALALVGTAILAATAVYTLATVAFGLRFSNMTHRGVLARGPYAVVRHPAYAAKTLSWWLAAVPFLHGPGDTVRLGLWTALYVGRALTEERHLMDDPDYRAYALRVRWRFVPGVW